MSVVLASAICLASCHRSPAARAPSPGSAGPAAASSREAATRAPESAANAAVAKSATVPESGPLPTGRRAAAAPPVVPVPPPASGAETGVLGLLCQGPQDGILPEDFAIGPLGCERLLGSEERAAYRAAASLLDAFARGKVDRAMLAAGSREALAGTLAFALEQGDRPVAWRLGPPRAAGAELVANLRLLGSDGSAEGELYARREGEEVLVSDLQIDPARMQVPRKRPDRTFFPSPYRWLLGG